MTSIFFSSAYLLCRDLFSMLLLGFYRDIIFIIVTSIFFLFSLSILSRQSFLWFLNNLFCDRVFFSHDRPFFSGPHNWLSCLLRHRDFYCDRIELAHHFSLKFSVATSLFFVVTEFFSSAIFIVMIEENFVAIEILPSVLHYVAT